MVNYIKYKIALSSFSFLSTEIIILMNLDGFCTMYGLVVKFCGM
jgi:hypothetical protein